MYLPISIFLLCTVIHAELSAKKVYKELTTPEEQSLSIVLSLKIKTDLLRSAFKYLVEKRDVQKFYTWAGKGCCAATSSNWNIMADDFTLSPDGEYYAIIKNDSYYDYLEERRVDYRFISIHKTKDNTSIPFTLPREVMSNPQSLTWGTDNKLYIEAENGTFCVTPEENPTVKLLTGVKGIPVYCAIDKSMYTNYDGKVRKYDVNQLKISQTSSFSGDNLTVAGKYIYFVRNSKQKTSEIWRKDITTGTEEKYSATLTTGL